MQAGPASSLSDGADPSSSAGEPVQLTRLRIENLRSIELDEIELAPGWNFFVGGNGAGKTSVLEAAFLLSHGRSFRAASRDALVRRGTDGYSVFGDFSGSHSRSERVGLARIGGRLEARLNGANVTASELMRHAAVVCFEPGSHELISGSSEERRRFLDWGVFHVEHDFLPTWRRYQRALKQRNAWLRQAASSPELDAWDAELAAAAVPLTRQRADYFARLTPIVSALLANVLEELGASSLSFHAGHAEGRDLAEVLFERRGRDIARMYTTAGPHRADWSVGFEGAPRREHLSRGQEKLCAFACIMGQAMLFAEMRGEWPVVALDDLASEIDDAHQRRVIEQIGHAGAQILATGTYEPPALAASDVSMARFHVEQGRVTRLL